MFFNYYCRSYSVGIFYIIYYKKKKIRDLLDKFLFSQSLVQPRIGNDGSQPRPTAIKIKKKLFLAIAQCSRFSFIDL